MGRCFAVFLLGASSVCAMGWWERFAPFMGAGWVERLDEHRFRRRLRSLGDFELVVLESEAREQILLVPVDPKVYPLDMVFWNVVEEARAEIFRRLPDDVDAGIVGMLEQVLKARLGGVLDGAKRADVFLDAVSDALRGDPPRAYRGILEGIVLAHADSFWRHDPSPEQCARLAAVMGRVPVLEGALARAQGAGYFFRVLDAFAPLLEFSGEDAELKRFFDSRGASIGALGPSPEQAGRLSKHVRILSVASLVGETIKAARAAPHDRVRSNIVLTFAQKNIGTLSPDDAIRLAKTAIYDRYRDTILAEFVQKHIGTLPPDDAIRIARTAVYDKTRSEIVLRFARANTGRLTGEDLRGLARAAVYDSYRDSILELVTDISCGRGAAELL